MAGETKKKATRESYGEALRDFAETYENLVVLDADLAAATKTGIFKKAYPERFFDCGIAEANMMGVAAGLAASGKIPFASTFAMFAAGRAYEIVRNSIGYPHLNVKIGATHAGISVGEDGATHQCNEDIALMRTIPGMTILNPADDVEARAAVKAAIEMEGPVYLRFGRLAAPIFNDPETYQFEIGKGITLREGKDVTLVATGLMVSEALDAAEQLAADGISARPRFLNFARNTNIFFCDNIYIGRINIDNGIRFQRSGTPIFLFGFRLYLFLQRRILCIRSSHGISRYEEKTQ